MVKSICIGHGECLGLGYGGTVRVVSLASLLAERGYDVHLVAPKATNTNSTPPGLESVTLHTVKISTRGAIDQLPRAALVSRRAKTIADEHNAVLQLERGTLAGVGTFVGASDYVVDLHDIGYNGPLYANLPFSSVIKRFVYHMERRGVKHASHVIAVSDRMAEFVHSEWGVKREQIHVIHNGVRSEILDFDFGSGEVPGQVSFIGSLNYNINYKKIVKIATEVDQIEIHVIGDGYKRDDLEEAVREHNLNNVIIHGFLPDDEAYEILAESQVCIFPLMDTHHSKVAQHMKGFDYAALGKAIATDRDSTAEILEANEAALVSDASQPEELVANVRRLLGDDALRKELGTNARKLAREFSWSNQGSKLAEFYSQNY